MDFSAGMHQKKIILTEAVAEVNIIGLPFYYIAINILSDFRLFITLKTTFYGAYFRFCIFG